MMLKVDSTNCQGQSWNKDESASDNDFNKMQDCIQENRSTTSKTCGRVLRLRMMN